MKLKIIDTPNGACLKIYNENGRELSLAFIDREKPINLVHNRTSLENSADYAIEINGNQVFEFTSFTDEIRKFLNDSYEKNQTELMSIHLDIIDTLTDCQVVLGSIKNQFKEVGQYSHAVNHVHEKVLAVQTRAQKVFKGFF